MKTTAIELLNLVMLHCDTSKEDSAFSCLQEIDDIDDKTELRNIILSCLDDLKNEFQTY